MLAGPNGDGGYKLGRRRSRFSALRLRGLSPLRIPIGGGRLVRHGRGCGGLAGLALAHRERGTMPGVRLIRETPHPPAALPYGLRERIPVGWAVPGYDPAAREQERHPAPRMGPGFRPS